MEYIFLLNHWLLNAAIFLLVISFVLLFYIMGGLRRKFDPVFKKTPDSVLDLKIFPSGTDYASCIAYPKLLGKKYRYLFLLYEGYDFRKDCNILQIILAWIYTTFGFLGLLSLVIHLTLGWVLDAFILIYQITSG